MFGIGETWTCESHQRINSKIDHYSITVVIASFLFHYFNFSYFSYSYFPRFIRSDNCFEDNHTSAHNVPSGLRAHAIPGTNDIRIIASDSEAHIEQYLSFILGASHCHGAANICRYNDFSNYTVFVR